MPLEQLQRLDLCLHEALANIVEHGHCQGQSITLQFELVAQPGQCGAQITVSNAGPAFDSSTAATAPRPRSLREAQPGGLGLHMLRSFSDTLHYQRIADSNVLCFGVHWPAGTAHAAA